jgi:hypothetical protein
MDVESYIESQPEYTKQIMMYFHDELMKIPGIEAKIRYKIPFYYRKSWICYLNPVKSGGVEFAFPRGNELSNSHGLLQSKGRKQVRSITYKSFEDINHDIIFEIINEALILDENVKYASKRAKK